MRPSTIATSLASALLVLGGSVSAQADTFTFNFSGLTQTTSMATTSTEVAAYLNSKLGTAGTATESGGVTDNGYTADGHVTGPRTGNNPGNYSVNPYTLADKDGTFLINDNEFGGNSNDVILNFNLGGAKITSVTFDYEIFPDVSCPDLRGNDCGHGNPPANLPSIELVGTSFIQYASAPPSSPAPPIYTYSPDSLTSAELAPQWIGTATVNGLNTTTLDFRDWPATIGVANITITTTGTTQGGQGTVPEPTSLVLFGTVASLLTFKLRNMRRSRG